MVNEEYDGEIEDYSDDEDEEDTFNSVIMGVVSVSFVSSLLIFIISMILVMMNDYAILNVYNVGVLTNNMTINGNKLLPDMSLQAMQQVANTMKTLPPYIDYLWLMFFVIVVGYAFVYSYTSKRESAHNTFSLVLFGLIIAAFVSGIFFQLSTWFRTNIMSIFSATFTNTPMFNFYLTNSGIINIVIIAICVILRFVDFDNFSFYKRKDKEIDAGNSDEI